MAKHGIGSVLPFLLPAAAIATGGLLAPALFGGEAAAGAGALAAGEAAPAAAGLATDAGLASAINAAPITAGLGDAVGTAALGATPLTAGAVDAATAAAGAGGISGLGDITAGALPAANTLGGTALPVATDAGVGLSGDALANLTGGTSFFGNIDAAPAAGAAPATDATIAPTSFGGGPGIEAGTGANTAAGGTFSSADSSGLGSDIWEFIKKNPGLLASVGGLGLEAIRGQQPIPGSNQLTQNAALAQGAATTAEQRAQAALANQGQFLAQAGQNLNAPNTGALPPGELAAINNAASAAKTQIRSQFAAMGIPANSTMETQQLAQVDQQVAAARLDAANKLAQLGVNEAQIAQGQGGLAVQQGQLGLEGEGLAARDLTTLMNAQILRDQQMQNVLARFAAAAAGPATARVPPRFDTTQETA